MLGNISQLNNHMISISNKSAVYNLFISNITG